MLAVVCILCILISTIDIVYPLDAIYIRIKEMAFILSLFFVAIIDFFRINEKREFKHYLFLVLSSLAFILTLYKMLL